MKKKLTTLLLLFSLSIIITGCGKEETLQTVEKTDMGDYVIEVKEKNAEQEELETNAPFTLKYETFTLELGQPLDTNILTYVETNTPENITMSIGPRSSDKPAPFALDYENEVEYFANALPVLVHSPVEYPMVFTHKESGFTLEMTLKLVDTIPPVITSTVNTLDVYTLYIPEYTHSIARLTSGDIKELHSLYHRDDTVNIADFLSFETSYYDGTIYAIDVTDDVTDATNVHAHFKSTNTEGYNILDYYTEEGSYEDVIIFTDEGNNTTEYPVTINIINDLSPEYKEILPQSRYISNYIDSAKELVAQDNTLKDSETLQFILNCQITE